MAQKHLKTAPESTKIKIMNSKTSGPVRNTYTYNISKPQGTKVPMRRTRMAKLKKRCLRIEIPSQIGFRNHENHEIGLRRPTKVWNHTSTARFAVENNFEIL